TKLAHRLLNHFHGARRCDPGIGSQGTYTTHIAKLRRRVTLAEFSNESATDLTILLLVFLDETQCSVISKGPTIAHATFDCPSVISSGVLPITKFGIANTTGESHRRVIWIGVQAMRIVGDSPLPLQQSGVGPGTLLILARVRSAQRP